VELVTRIIITVTASNFEQVVLRLT